jgi:ABC-type microcin C transport system duplicated ATPase subunit YejF
VSLPERRTYLNARYSTQWLSLTIQHIAAVQDLSLRLQRPISITVLDPPKTSLGRKQASLNDLLDAIVYQKDDIRKIKEALNKTAAKKLLSKTVEAKQGWAKLTQEA